MSELLPVGWVAAELGSVASFVRGITFPASAKLAQRSEDSVGCLRTSNVQRTVEWSDVYFVPRAYVRRAEQLVASGDTLISMANSYELVGKVAFADAIPFPSAFGAFLAAARPRASLNGRYIFFLLKSPVVQENIRRSSSQSVNIANISVSRLEKLSVPIAPLGEQQRIADKLDTLLARIDACRDRLDRVGPLLQRFRQSVLMAVVSGRLSDDLVGGMSSWQDLTLGDIADVGTGATPLRSNPSFFAETGTPWITSSATGRERIDRATEFVTSAAITAHRLRIYPPGTLLMAMYGEGRTRGQVAELAISATINQACAAITVNEALADRGFVKLALQADYWGTRALAEGGNQPNLNLSKVRGIRFRLPGLPEQRAIVARARQLLALADAFGARLAEVDRRASRLIPSTLAKAFRGELVPQDPHDEPASALLARLQAPAAAAEPARRRRRAPVP